MGTLDEARAALERGRPVMLVLPPAPEGAQAVWDLTGGLRPGNKAPVLIICADQGSAVRWAECAPAELRAHAVTGLTRTTRMLRDRASAPDLIAGDLRDLATLVTRSVLKLDGLSRVIVAWPEPFMGSEHAATLDTLLGAAHGAPRVVLAWNPALLQDFLERHARRAEVVGALPVDENGKPLPPVGAARYVIVPPAHREAALRDAIDALDPKRPFVWRRQSESVPPETDQVFCAALPTREQFAQLSGNGAAPVVFVTGAELPYLRSIAAPLTALVLGSAADAAGDRAAALRAKLTEIIEAGRCDAELALLDPLFERFDPAAVAAAILALREEGGRGKGEAAQPAPPAATERTKVFVNVGKKDKAAAKDIVGALIKEVRLSKGDIGRVDVRETFSIVEVAAARAAQVVQDLARVSIRGRRVTARLDRYS